jgi:hypothetical protein
MNTQFKEFKEAAAQLEHLHAHFVCKQSHSVQALAQHMLLV